MLDLLLKRAHVYAPEDLGVVNVGIADGKIACVGNEVPPAARVVDCDGAPVLPGVIETHAHMLLPFGGTHTMNDFYDGTMAGALGGVTTLIDFADQAHGGTVTEALEARLALAADCAVDYSFHCTLTDITEDCLREIPALVARGITSFKFYTAYSASGLYVPADRMAEAFRHVAACGALATVHCETEEEVLAATERLIEAGKTQIRYFPLSRPDESEESAIAGVIALARETGVKLLIRHVSSAAGVRLIAQAQAAGQTVIGETCPHYLLLTREVYGRENGADFICNPPIRGEADRDALWGALESGVKFTIGTDDCAFYLAQKRVSDRFDQVPGGVPGIETRMPILLSMGVGRGRFGYERLAHLTATDVAKVYGLYPQKGRIAVGSDADLILVEPCEPYPLTIRDLHEKSDYTPFEGLPLTARIRMTVARGNVVAENGAFTGRRGGGRLLQRGLPASLGEL